MEGLLPHVANENKLRQDAAHEDIQIARRNLVSFRRQKAAATCGNPEFGGIWSGHALAHMHVERLIALIGPEENPVARNLER